MGYYVLACDEDGEFVATIKLHSQEEAEKCAYGFVNSPSFRNVEIVKVVKHIEKDAAAEEQGIAGLQPATNKAQNGPSFEDGV